ncbi:hypothetical protein ACA910_012972 [Epithemia clementina (nom. ined.)]
MTSPTTTSNRTIRDGIGIEELRSWAITMLQAYGSHDSQTNSSSANDATDVKSMNDLLRAARTGETKANKIKWTERLRENDPELTRLDLSSAILRELNEEEKADMLQCLPFNETVRIVHLSGLELLQCMTYAEIVQMVEGVRKLKNLEELFVFRGKSGVLNEELLGQAVSEATNLRVLMLWGYGNLDASPDFAAVLRHHPSLNRVTITLPENMAYACMDVYVMGFAEMEKLYCLNLRGSGKQKEPVVSPEAIALLLGSKSIESLYLENVGLVDDHTDAICAELRTNKRLGLLDLKDNLLSDDALFTFAQTLPHNNTLQSLDISGVLVTDRGGMALAKGLAANSTLSHLELEGTAAKYADEFDIKPGHEEKDWYKAIDYQLRLNRAGPTGNRKKFVEALNSVSDHLGCLYTFVRQSPHYCDLHPTHTGAAQASF